MILIKRLSGIVLFTLLLSFTVVNFNLGTARAESNKEAVCQGAGLVLDAATGGCATPTGTPTKTVEDNVKTGLNIFSIVAGIIAVVMIMISGLKYITSGGESAKVASAQNTALYAAVGIMIVVLAQVLVKFVVGKFAN